MDPLSVAASVAAIISFSIEVVVLKNEMAKANLKELSQDLVDEGLFRLFFRLSFPSVWRAWRLIDKIVLPGDDATVENFRLSYASDCNITAVGGAIIAQVATTALVLPNLDKTHWIARALFVTSLSSGCFSVYYACRTQKTVGTLYHPNDLKDWLSRKPSLPLSKNAIRLRMYELNLFEKDLRRFSVAQEVWNDDFETVFLGFQNKFIEWENSRRSASISAAFMVRAPCLYLQLALGSFVSGFAVYLWSNWRRNIDRVDNAGQTDAWNKNEARNIFILFMLIFGPLFVYERCAFSKDLDLQPLRAWRDYERKLNKCALLVQEYRSRSNGSATVLRDGDFAAPVADANDVEMGAAAIELPDLAPSTANTFIPNDRSNAHGISILPDGPLDSTIPSPPTDGGLQAIMLKLASALEEYKSAQLASTSALKASTEAQMASTRKLENLDSILSNLASIPR